MKLTVRFLIVIAALLLLFKINSVADEKSAFKEGDPAEKEKFEFMKLRNPQTGKIPDNIRLKEIEFSERLREKELISAKSGGRELMSGHWMPAGPFNIGGRTRALAIDRNNPEIMLQGIFQAACGAQ